MNDMMESCCGGMGMGIWMWVFVVLILTVLVLLIMWLIKQDKGIAKGRKIELVATVFVLGFILNLVWENAQAPFYAGYTGFQEHFMICFWASLVDAVVILVLAALVSVWRNGLSWMVNLGWKEALVLMVVGGAVAVLFEHWALKNEVWEYTEKMPVVVVLNTGLLPLFQMMLLPLLTFYIAGMFFRPRPGESMSS